MNENEVMSKWSIIIVEDDEGLNSLIQRKIERVGLKTYGATSAEESLKLIESSENILIILDYKLPDIDGVSFIEKISENQRNIPFIVLTGQGDEQTAVEFMKLGARDYLIKEANVLEFLPKTVMRVIREFENEENLRKTELALKQSEANYRTLVNNLGEGIVVFDDEGKISFVNPMTEALLNLKNDDLIGRNIKDFVDQKVFTDIQNIARSGNLDSLKNVDLTIEVQPNIKLEVIFSIVAPIIDESPLNGFIGTFRDITDRVNAERKAHYLAKLVEGVSDAIISTDSEFRIASWNKGAENLYGWKADEVVGKPLSDVLKTEYPENNDSEVIGEEHREVIQKQKDGKKIIALPSVSFFKEEGKNTNGMVVVYHDITERKHAESELKKSYDKLKQIFDSVVEIIGKIVEVRDPYTAGHERRVSKLSVAIARKLNLDDNSIVAIRIAGALHDIGKIYVPSEILSKPGILSKQEFELIKVHPALGFEILETIDFPWEISEIVLQHHERLDGSGYPNGIKNKEILFESKIIAVADVVEAMSSHRPYRPAPGLEAALEEIVQNRGKLYEPSVVDACIRLFREDWFAF